MDAAKKLSDVKAAKSFRGRKELMAFLSGKKITRTQAMTAYCYDCMGYYADGVGDCGCTLCPMHPFMPYAKVKQTKPTAPRKPLSAAHKKKLAEGRAKAQKG